VQKKKVGDIKKSIYINWNGLLASIYCQLTNGYIKHHRNEDIFLFRHRPNSQHPSLTFQTLTSRESLVKLPYWLRFAKSAKVNTVTTTNWYWI